MVLLCAVAGASTLTPAQVPKAPSSASGSGTDVLALENLGKGLAPVDGSWQFHLGDDPSYSSPTLDDAEGNNGWERLTTDKTWGAQTHPAYVGYAWYRRHIHVQPAVGETPDMAMLLQRVDDAYEVYWNGRLIGSFGKLPPYPVHYYHPPAQTLGLGPVTDGVIAFRVWKAPLNSFDSDQLGGFYFPPVIGSPAAIGAPCYAIAGGIHLMLSVALPWLHSIDGSTAACKVALPRASPCVSTRMAVASWLQPVILRPS